MRESKSSWGRIRFCCENYPANIEPPDGSRIGGPPRAARIELGAVESGFDRSAARPKRFDRRFKPTDPSSSGPLVFSGLIYADARRRLREESRLGLGAYVGADIKLAWDLVCVGAIGPRGA